MSPFSTLEVAGHVGIDRTTLERWLSDGSINPPKMVRIGSQTYRLWTHRDIDQVKRYKEKSYWKGRGRKKKAKE